MNELINAITSDGRKIVLILFTIWPPGGSTNAPPVMAELEPGEVRAYYLEDLDGRLAGRVCFEYDLIAGDVPDDLESLVRVWLVAALDIGAEVAWFGFEGSFDFEHILTPDVADQIYAVGSSRGVALALEDAVRRSQRWAHSLADARGGLLGPTRVDGDV